MALNGNKLQGRVIIYPMYLLVKHCIQLLCCGDVVRFKSLQGMSFCKEKKDILML